MSNCILKVQLNEYYPKIDNIPYNHYICLLIYNNYYSEIKLSNNKENFFQYKLRIIDNSSDILLKVKLLNSLQNSIIGKGDLIIPFIKLKQMINNYNNFLAYHQLLKIGLDSKIIVKSFNQIMNVTNIYLDFTIELYSIDNYRSCLIKNDSFYKSPYDDGKKTFRGAIQLNNSERYNRYKNNYNISNNNNIHEFDNSDSDMHSDINNLNYISTDSNNYYNNYKLLKKPYKNIKLNPSELSLIKNNNKDNQLEYSFFNTSRNNQFIRKTNRNPYILTEIFDDNNYSNNLELNQNNIINNSNYNINENNFINNEKSIFSMTNNNFYINKKQNQNFPYYLSPINNNNDNNDSNIKLQHNYNYTQTFDRSSFTSSTINSKKEMSSVLSFFRHVKPFTKINIKKNSIFYLKKIVKRN